MHEPGDNINNMNLDYWLEQMKASTATAAELAEPIIVKEIPFSCYLPLITKVP